MILFTDRCHIPQKGVKMGYFLCPSTHYSWKRFVFLVDRILKGLFARDDAEADGPGNRLPAVAYIEFLVDVP